MRVGLGQLEAKSNEGPRVGMTKVWVVGKKKSKERKRKETR